MLDIRQLWMNVGSRSLCGLKADFSRHAIVAQYAEHIVEWRYTGGCNLCYLGCCRPIGHAFRPAAGLLTLRHLFSVYFSGNSILARAACCSARLMSLGCMEYLCLVTIGHEPCASEEPTAPHAYEGYGMQPSHSPTPALAIARPTAMPRPIEMPAANLPNSAPMKAANGLGLA